MQTFGENSGTVDEAAASDRREEPRFARMLVVEDAQCGEKIAEAVATCLGIEVDTAANNRIACILATISLAEGRPYDAVLINMEGSNTDGEGTVAWLRQQGWQVPIIAVGVNIVDEQRRRFLAAGCNDVVDKPLSHAKLQAAFARLIEQQSGEAAPATAAAADQKGVSAEKTQTTVAEDKPAAAKDEASPVDEKKSIKLHARVLVVEDAFCMQTIEGEFLRRLGVDVEMASNGETACQMAMRSLSDGVPYDVILMDIQMPKMNGKQATRWLRENGWQGPIIAVSGHNTAKDQAAIMTAGCNNLLAKPITQASLQKALTQCLLGPDSQSPTATSGETGACPD
jgi:CheY-like chemotaxis protein